MQRRFRTLLQVRTIMKFEAVFTILLLAAALRREVSASGNEHNSGAVRGPTATRKRTAGAAPTAAAPPKAQAMRPEATHGPALQDEDVQLPSQLSQKAAASQPLDAIGNNSDSIAGRRAGRGSRLAAIVRRLS